MLIVAVAVIASGSDDPRPVVAGDSSSEPASQSTSTSEPVSTTTVDTAPNDASATSTTALVCRDSDNPECGPFYFDPPVDNQPMTGSMVLSSTQPHAGQPVDVTVTASDPDAKPLVCLESPADMDAPVVSIPQCAVTMCVVVYSGYGPHDPPPTNGGSGSGTISLTFPHTGSYTVRVSLQSRAANCGGSVYDSHLDLEVDVVVS